MRFRSIDFRCFGPFEEMRLDFPEARGLQIVHGPNEAGKSSSLRGLMALLFGFPKSGDEFRFKYQQFRVHAVLEGPTGTVLECVRRKGNKDTLRAADDKTVLSEQVMTELLGGMDESRYQQLFGLDAQRLVTGGHDIASGHGELGEALFAAGAGMRGLRQAADRFEAQRRKLFVPNGKSQRIPELLRTLDEHRKRERNTVLPPEIFAAAETEAASLADRARALAAQRDQTRARSRLLERFRAALPSIDALRLAREALAPIASAPLLSAEFEPVWEQTVKAQTRATVRIADLRGRIEGLERQIEAQCPDPKWLAEILTFKELQRQMALEPSRKEEWIKADTRRRDEEQLARDIYRELTGSKDWSGMDELKLTLLERERIHEVAQEHTAMEEALKQSELALRRIQRTLEEMPVVSADTAVLADLPLWRRTMEELSSLGPLEDQLAVRRAEIEVQESQLAARFARMNPAAPGDWRDAAELPVPSLEAVMDHRAQIDQARRAHRDIQASQRNLQDEQDRVRIELAHVRDGDPPPTLEELTQSRRDRDGGMRLLRRYLADRAFAPELNEFVRRHAPQGELIDAAETSVQHCDVLADRMRAEAERVAKRQDLETRADDLRIRRERIDQEWTDSARRLDGARNAWIALWHATEISPEDPDPMVAWVNEWRSFRDAVVGWRERCARADRDTAGIERHRQSLSRLFPPASQAKTLAAALIGLKQAISAAESVEAARLQRSRAGEQLRAVEEDVSTAMARQATWKKNWCLALAPLGHPDGKLSVKVAREYLERIDQMQLHLKDARIKAARARELGDQRMNCVAALTELRRRLDPAAEASTEQTASADYLVVETRMSQVSEQVRQVELLRKNLLECQESLAKEIDSLQNAESELWTLALEVGAAEIEQIPEVLQRARERQLRERDVHKLEEVMIGHAAGESLDVFIAQAISERDRLDEELQAMAPLLQDLDRQISAAEEEARESARVLESYRAVSDAAAEARQAGVLVIAELRELVTEYAALHLAGRALEMAKDRYRRRHQDTMLHRAGEYFRALTDGAFAELDMDNDDGHDVLIAVRGGEPPGDRRVRVEGLSDGTRDQLFLALRLAGIDRHLSAGKPVPLIVDDVLVNFDDRRAQATLTCLRDLAQKTQVLIFTHHRHLVDLARTVDPFATIHELHG